MRSSTVVKEISERVQKPPCMFQEERRPLMHALRHSRLTEFESQFKALSNAWMG